MIYESTSLWVLQIFKGLEGQTLWRGVHIALRAWTPVLTACSSVHVL